MSHPIINQSLVEEGNLQPGKPYHSHGYYLGFGFGEFELLPNIKTAMMPLKLGGRTM